MAAAHTTQPRTRERRPAVPMLLESFPAPPSFIPPSPLLSGPSSPFPRSASPLPSPATSPQSRFPPSGPPSSPPSGPLPPVPGPSPISEHDTLMFISAARSRRASKMSLASSVSSQRDSIISLSNFSLPSLSPSASTGCYDSSASRSIRSYSSSSSLSVPGSHQRHPERSPVIQPRITEEDAADLTRMYLDDVQGLPEHLSDDEKVLQIGLRPNRRRMRYDHARDSISSVDMSEIPPIRDYDDDDSPGANIPAPTEHTEHTLRSPVDADLPPPPPLPSAFSSAETSARASTSSSATAAPPPTRLGRTGSGSSTSSSRLPARSKSQPQHARRSSSPEIDDLLARTPRPRRQSSRGDGLRSASHSRSRSASRVRGPSRPRSGDSTSAPGSRRTSAGRRDDGERGRRMGKTPRRSGSSTDAAAYEQTAMVGAGEPWDEDSFVSDYGTPLDGTGTPFDMLDAEAEARLDRELEASDSDSDLDLHTPLPQLMVRDGLLSPNSKLVASSRATTPALGERPGSVVSIASTTGSMMTKKGLFKDERDTTRRRVRHRDGKLLRGGIGLTTGLGWSDSEDEDAPAPLVRRLSMRSLRSRPSLRSIRYSEEMTENGLEEFGMLPKPPPSSAPPTSWSSRNAAMGGMARRPSTSSSWSSASGSSKAQSRASVASSLRSASSHRGLETSALTTKSLGHIRERDELLHSPSTSSSSASAPTPTTPADARPPSRGASAIPRKASFARLDRLATADLVAGSTHNPHVTTSPATPATPRSATVPRPLRLPQAAGLRISAVGGAGSHFDGARSTPAGVGSGSASGSRSAPSSATLPAPPSRVPSLQRRSRTPATPTAAHDRTMSASASQSQSQAQSQSQSPAGAGVSRSTSAGASARPRTGTGMVYRTSGGRGASTAPTTPTTPGGRAAPSAFAFKERPTMLRKPSTGSLRAAAAAARSS
ncbi:uncharacterized protein BXZ73DRAFT_88780 [Epithele typhae]|uniref:uncharacterized protein n=1 Tax=Epithele typhae TaxID=378194 RepID=UPI002008B686|nr:uncharacterized protein BXZ73DRAFT_88780 [Epithele typhae]KAH9940018.1 hypothetical protein BXZ73DRAFT_88780 [Epithele typhae]